MPLLHRRSSPFVMALITMRSYAPAVWLALSVGMGQIAVWLCGEIWSGALAACCGLTLLVSLRFGRGFLLVGLLLGILTAYPALFSHIYLAEAPDAVILGEISSPPRRPRPGEIVFELTTIGDSKSVRLRCRAIDLPWRNAAELQEGDIVSVRGSIRPVERPLNPLSWGGWLWRNGVAGECKARFVSRALDRAPPFLSRIRAYVLDLVRDRVGDNRGSALFLSMALGYHDILSPTVEGAFQALGLTHLLVVSGYQVSLVFGLVVRLASLIGTRLSLGRHARLWIMGAAFLCALLYVLLIGAEMSAVRALIAAGCVCAHLLTETGARFAQRWGIALFVMQMVWSWCILEIGVILTFAALLGIGLGVQLGAGRQVSTYLWVTVAAWVCTSFVVVCWSGSFSVVSLLLNFLLAAPWSMLNCTAGFVGLLLLLANIPGGAWILQVVSWVNFYLAELLIYMRDLPLMSFALEGAWRVAVSLALGASLSSLLLWSALTWNPARRSQ